MKICFRCKNEINEEDNYFAMCEYNNKKLIKTDYVHKICWNKFMNQLDGASASLVKSNILFNAIGNQFKKMGLIKDEVVIQ